MTLSLSFFEFKIEIRVNGILRDFEKMKCGVDSRRQEQKGS
jgi:hypothetical protein